MMLETAMAGPFSRKFVPATIPTQVQKVQNYPSKIEILMYGYQKILNEHEKLRRILLCDSPYDSLVDYVGERLGSLRLNFTNQELQQFIAVSTGCENEKYYCSLTGAVISYYLQVAHDNGENNFVLDFHGTKPIDEVACGLQQREGRSLEVVLRGTVGDSCAYSAIGGTYYIEHAEILCGCNSVKTTFYVETAGIGLGDYSSSTFYVERIVNIPLTDIDLASLATYHTNDSNLRVYLKHNDFHLHSPEKWKVLWEPALRKWGRYP